MSDDNDSKTEQFCGICVHTLTKWIALISIFTTTLAGVIQWTPHRIPMEILRVLVCIVLYYGVEKKRPTLYLPYLFVYVFFIVFIFVLSPLLFERFQFKAHFRIYDIEMIMFIYIASGFAILPLLYVFIFIPYRSYRLTVSENQKQSFFANYPADIIVTPKVNHI
ncbi:hypothetical protein M3Y97_00647200 [Aphelenchoides bicaudatus]|nr:hypothetical protein M3Y97_00647200 [Aphelenchoides bicaudatus]